MEIFIIDSTRLKKLLFIIIITAVLISLCYIFFVDVNITKYMDQDKVKNRNINSYIVQNDFNMKAFINKVINNECLNNDKACRVTALYKYFTQSFLLVNDDNTSIIPNPQRAFRSKEGSYQDLTVLFSSLLLNAGISTYIKKRDNELLVYACGISNEQMYNAILSDIRKIPLSSKDVILKNKQIWAVDLSRGNNDKPLVIDINAIASKPFDFMLFPNKTEMNAYLKGQYSMFNETCSKMNTLNVNITCIAPKEGFLLFRSKDNNNQFSGKITKGGIIIGDIKSEKSKQNNNCIEINIRNKGEFAYPGIHSL